MVTAEDISDLFIFYSLRAAKPDAVAHTTCQ